MYIFTKRKFTTMRIVFSFFILSFCFFGILSAQSITNVKSIIDSRDGQEYKAVRIGNQTWMAENLNFETEEGSCCYNDLEGNCVKYGRLYNLQTAKHVCPSGWHLPSKQEFEVFNVTTVDTSGQVIVSFSSIAYGVFSNQVSGCRYYDESGFDGADIFGTWWSSTEDEDGQYMGLTCMQSILPLLCDQCSVFQVSL
jgi:uncharacterized protein (TIGR02145 family)